MRPTEYSDYFYENIQDIRKKSLELLQKYPIKADTETIGTAFDDTQRLFNGEYPGFQASNTKYHDFPHTASVFLAMIRLMDGALLEDKKLTTRGVTLGAAAALFHDTGLIMRENDNGGTGAKYTIGHENRSISLAQDYLSKIGGSEKDKDEIAKIIDYTRMRGSENKEDPAEQIKILGKCLGTADIMAQMSDRFYLEKLFCLYQEFQEAGIKGYDSEYDLLAKTKGFYNNIVIERLNNELGNARHFFKVHFRERFGKDIDFYSKYIQKNIQYLSEVLEKNDEDYQHFFKRDVSCLN